MDMSSCFLSYSSTACAPSRGICELARLSECNDTIESHMRSVHLSSENMNEQELILARAGYFDLPQSKIRDLLAHTGEVLETAKTLPIPVSQGF